MLNMSRQGFNDKKRFMAIIYYCSKLSWSVCPVEFPANRNVCVQVQKPALEWSTCSERHLHRGLTLLRNIRLGWNGFVSTALNLFANNYLSDCHLTKCQLAKND